VNKKDTNALNLSCPAVSQICNLMDWPVTSLKGKQKVKKKYKSVKEKEKEKERASQHTFFLQRKKRRQ
jgi:hypothetical protein